MAIRYDKLFHLMIDRKITNTQLKDMAGVSANIITEPLRTFVIIESANIITRLKRDEYVSIESVEKICKALNCSVDEILEFLHDD